MGSILEKDILIALALRVRFSQKLYYFKQLYYFHKKAFNATLTELNILLITVSNPIRKPIAYMRLADNRMH